MKMRAFALALTCALVLAACGNNATLPPPTGPGPIDECGPGPGPNGQPCP